MTREPCARLLSMGHPKSLADKHAVNHQRYCAVTKGQISQKLDKEENSCRFAVLSSRLCNA